MTSEEGSSRRRRQAATATGIERNAVALVLEHGLDGVTVDMICQASGISQRTFFNYFKTKDAAILGSDVPTLDETAVRRFIASDSPSIIEDAIDLIGVPGPVGDPELALDRMRIVAGNTDLMQKQMERFASVYAEMQDILYLRMRRRAPRDETEADTREYAAVATAVISGVLRFSAERALVAKSSDGMDPARIARLLTTVLPRMVGDATSD